MSVLPYCTSAVIERSMAHDLLNVPEERRLLTAAQDGNHEAVEELLAKNQRLVIKIARTYYEMMKMSDVELGDFVQQGNIGLLRAITKWDFSKNVRFSTYAYWWIRQAIQRHFLTHNSQFKVSVRFAEKMSKVRVARSELMSKSSEEPTVKDLAEVTGIPIEEVELALATDKTNLQLDGMWADSKDEFGIANDENVEEEAFDQVVVDQISLFVMRFPSQMQKVINHRFGLNGYEELTQLELAKRLGISRQAVQDVERRALGRIKRMLRLDP